MKLSISDYKKILKFYKLSVPKNKKKLEKKANKIIADKFCSCIKKVQQKFREEGIAIGICTNSVINRKGYKRGNFKCKKRRTINLHKGGNRKKKTRKKRGKGATISRFFVEPDYTWNVEQFDGDYYDFGAAEEALESYMNEYDSPPHTREYQLHRLEQQRRIIDDFHNSRDNRWRQHLDRARQVIFQQMGNEPLPQARTEEDFHHLIQNPYSDRNVSPGAAGGGKRKKKTRKKRGKGATVSRFFVEPDYTWNVEQFDGDYWNFEEAEEALESYMNEYRSPPHTIEYQLHRLEQQRRIIDDFHNSRDNRWRQHLARARQQMVNEPQQLPQARTEEDFHHLIQNPYSDRNVSPGAAGGGKRKKKTRKKRGGMERNTPPRKPKTPNTVESTRPPPQFIPPIVLPPPAIPQRPNITSFGAIIQDGSDEQMFRQNMFQDITSSDDEPRYILDILTNFRDDYIGRVEDRQFTPEGNFGELLNNDVNNFRNYVQYLNQSGGCFPNCKKIKKKCVGCLKPARVEPTPLGVVMDNEGNIIQDGRSTNGREVSEEDGPYNIWILNRRITRLNSEGRQLEKQIEKAVSPFQKGQLQEMFDKKKKEWEEATKKLQEEEEKISATIVAYPTQTVSMRR